MTDSSSQRWWGDYEVAMEHWARWQIGPLCLWARPSPGEWRLAWQSDNDPLTDNVGIANPADGEPDTEDFELTRFALESVNGGLRLSPHLAELSVIVRPETALWIPPGQKTVLFVGTTVRVRVASTGPGKPMLIELPTFRSSDTWFGSNTMSGELCYATRTRARTRMELLGRVPHRAITPIELVNFGIDTLQIEQLRIPVPALRLYESDGRLWTDGVRFTRAAGRSNAEFEILKSSESEHLPDERRKLSEPLTPMHHKTVIQAFSSLFS